MLIRNTKAHYPFNEKSIKIIEKDYPNQENNTIYQSIELFKEFIKNPLIKKFFIDRSDLIKP